ncbi:HPP family protein [Marinomonas fungiae]|uniref:HPP family protein n=1 Tax=Marinomonas fungiae TaxID=1137284 RepID=UPI003A938865
MWSSLARKMGIEQNQTSHVERLIAGLSTCLAIATVALLTQWSLSDNTHLLFFASSAASAFLVFALPHGPLSQPWPVMVGQLLAMLIGVLAGTLLGSEIIVAALAVGVTVLLMHYLRCLHPPGAATAFFFVTDIEHIPLQETCFAFLLNICVIVLLALVVNNAFSWRRYPSSSLPQQKGPFQDGDNLALEDLQFALQQHDVFIDISVEELKALYDTAQQQKHCKQYNKALC